MQALHEPLPASPWVVRWAHLIQPGQALLDVACGSGRHTQYFARRGCAVTALDVSAQALTQAATQTPGARFVQADLENQPWPLPGELFDAIVVTHYLHRPLMPTLLNSLAQGGVLIYETFAVGNEQFGKPSNPLFLLRPGELLTLCQNLQIIAYEQGFVAAPSRVLQRIVARHATTKMVG